MKKKIYLAILISIILISIYQIIFLSFKNYIWAIGALVFWAWVKNDIIAIIGWCIDSKTTYKNRVEDIYIMSLPDFETQRKSYIELVKLCCSTENQQKLIPFFETIKDYQDNEVYGTTLDYVIIYLTENNYWFIVNIDWKQEVEDLEFYLYEMIKQNYNGLKIDFPKNLDDNENLFLEDVFETYNKCLQKHGIQMGFIDTQSDQYVFFVHKVKHKEEIIPLINLIGYNYLEK